MSRSPALVNVCPVYGSVHRPVSTTHRRVSRKMTAMTLCTISFSGRVSWQSPSASIQCRQSSRLFRGIFEGSAAIVTGVADRALVGADPLGAVGLWPPQLATRITSSRNRGNLFIEREADGTQGDARHEVMSAR